MNIVVVDKSVAQVVELVTNHSRWSEEHRNICESCTQAYLDQLYQPEYEEIEEC